MSIQLLAIHSLQIVHLMKQKSKLGCYRRKDCMEWFCKNLRDHTMKIINYEQKEMIPLTDKENRSYEMQKNCHIKKNLVLIMTKSITNQRSLSLHWKQ